MALSAAGAAYLGFEADEKIYPHAVNANLRLSALKVASEEFGKPYNELLWRHFQETDNAANEVNVEGSGAVNYAITDRTSVEGGVNGRHLTAWASTCTAAEIKATGTKEVQLTR